MINAAICQPIYGCFTRWPVDGTSWLHPDDVHVMLTLIPSDRIFCRRWLGGEYSQLTYGRFTIRARPTLWQVVRPGQYQVGDLVQIRSQMMQQEPGLAFVREVFWNRHTAAAWYELEQREMILPHRFHESQLRPVEPLQKNRQSADGRRRTGA
jgi:hypothetical protein